MSGPSPTIKPVLSDAHYERLCDKMGLKTHPPVRVVTSGNQEKFYGIFYPTPPRIVIYANMREFDAGALRGVNYELVNTLLHELRHAWQQEQHGKEWYEKNVVEAERDANKFAEANVASWRGVIRVTRKFHGSGISRLGKTEARVRGAT